jgi:BirA family biotin operon repressor/biotin-[acetyl-CoA-carboxylase] ligase
MAITLGQRALAAGSRLVYFDTTGSTNSEARQAARAGERGPMWFVTTEQVAGKGRRDRAWISPRGNLCCSILQTVEAAPGLAATLGFVAGLAQVQALDAVSGRDSPGYRLKWPNDVLVDGAKLVGINLEAEVTADGKLAIWAGLGTNIVSAPQGTPHRACCLADVGVRTDAAQLFAALSDAWVTLFALWDQGRGFPRIRDLWLTRAAGLGDEISVISGPTTISGWFETIDDSGCLVVRTPDARLTTVAAGDVYFGHARSVGASA